MPEEKRGVGKDIVGEDKPLFAWKSPEFHYHKKDAVWYLTIAITGVALGGALYLAGLVSGALVAVISVIVFMIISGVHPKTIECALYRDGILVDGKAFRFEQFKSFAFVSGDINKIKLGKLGTMASEVVVPLKNAEEDQIRAYLKKHLPESENQSEDLTDIINRWIRF